MLNRHKKCHSYEMYRQNEMQNLQTSTPKIINSTIKGIPPVYMV